MPSLVQVGLRPAEESGGVRKRATATAVGVVALALLVGGIMLLVLLQGSLIASIESAARHEAQEAIAQMQDQDVARSRTIYCRHRARRADRPDPEPGRGRRAGACAHRGGQAAYRPPTRPGPGPDRRGAERGEQRRRR